MRSPLLRSAVLLLLSGSTYAQEPIGILRRLQEVQPGHGRITVTQEPAVAQLMDAQILRSAARPGMQGFRLRIFFDLGATAGSQSLEVANRFMADHPGIPVYRTKEANSPYFKVAVGDFRTRDEALRLLRQIESVYPKAFIISEWVNFPTLYP